MKLFIAGPNLRDQSKGTFHVHAVGCADIARIARRESAYRNEDCVGEFATATEVCDLMYPPEDFDCASGEYLDDFHFFPCCANLPTE